ncbi:hypothetical protein WJX75_007395 [Coccomyxa subellipsoidea]|uniref:Uncharacterized protein n=1 Tax=Coccomyxa subellipsoidea TaxID=248742 RepID=A0ABR2YRX4_9CHLO
MLSRTLTCRLESEELQKLRGVIGPVAAKTCCRFHIFVAARDSLEVKQTCTGWRTAGDCWLHNLDFWSVHHVVNARREVVGRQHGLPTLTQAPTTRCRQLLFSGV